MSKASKDLSSMVWATMTSWLRDGSSASAKGRAERDVASSHNDTLLHGTDDPVDGKSELNEALESQPIDRRYTPIRMLGQGGFGRVYLTRDEFQDGQEVALKLIHRKFCGTPAIEKRFRDEIRNMRKFAHESVPQIFNDGKTEHGELYFTMRFVPGRSLRELIDSEAPFEEHRAIRIAVQIAEVLAYSHSKGLVHRDLKPPNVQVTATEGGEEHIALLDFGIAGAWHEAQESGPTVTTSLVGTPVYMPPERLRGRSATPAVDLYALGLVLYEMLSGEIPFSGATPMEVVASKLRDAGPPLLAFHSSPELAGLIRELTATEPQDRPTASVTVERLQAILVAPTKKRSRTKLLVFGGLAAVAAIAAPILIFRSSQPAKADPVLPAPADTEQPVFAATDDIKVDCEPGKSGATVKFKVSAQDNDDRTPTLAFDREPGFFEIGTQQVSCTATDSSGNQAQITFKVIVRDAEKPRIQIPAAIVRECDKGRPGTEVQFDVTATDNDGKIPKLVFDSDPGFFEIGTKQVICTATDSSGNLAQREFSVTVKDLEKPEIRLPAPIIRPCDKGKAGAVVSFDVTATDNDGRLPRITFDREPGFFEVGTKNVICVATDSSGNPTQKEFSVTVKDEEAPSIEFHPEIRVTCESGEAGKTVQFDVKAVDNADRNVAVVCSPKSGAFFKLGKTTVTCSAQDQSGNAAQPTQFEVIVTATIAETGPVKRLESGALPDPSNPALLLLRREDGLETKWRAAVSGDTAIEFSSCQVDPKSGTILVVVNSKLSDGESIASTMALASDVFRPLPPACKDPFLIDVHELDTGLLARFQAANAIPGRSQTGQPAAGLENSVAMGLSQATATAVARWLGKSLPSSMEWQTAALWGGDTQRRHPWGEVLVIAKVTFLDERPLNQKINPSTRDVSAYGVKDSFSGAREWAVGSDPRNSSKAYLMGPILVELLKQRKSYGSHPEAYNGAPSIYVNRFKSFEHEEDPGANNDDASVRCLVRLIAVP